MKTKILSIALTNALEGDDHVFRGHVFVGGVCVIIGDDMRLSGILNSLRFRLPHAVEWLEGQAAVDAYLAYCEAAGYRPDATALHHFDKEAGTDLNVEVPESPSLDDLLSDEDDEDDDEDDEDVLDGIDDVSDGDSDGSVDTDVDDLDPEVSLENDLRVALSQLDSDNNDHWTSTGLPAIDAVESFLGYGISRSDINRLFKGFKRNK